MPAHAVDEGLQVICDKITKLLDVEMFPWLATNAAPTDLESERSATIIADRLCGAQADPIIRNAQEQRQLAMIESWLIARGYERSTPHPAGLHPDTMPAGTFAFHMNIRVRPALDLNIPIDVVVQPKLPGQDKLPIMIEAKSAGDFTNVNKRRKEESDKMGHLKERFGNEVPYVLFLCGYFDTGYLGYEAAEGIDWVWEHRIDDLAGLGL
jgi:XamI restriction endonuclease